ncbi:MAG: hypothetical protein ACI4BC_02065 [Muribaculaceae bacterium]
MMLPTNYTRYGKISPNLSLTYNNNGKNGKKFARALSKIARVAEKGNKNWKSVKNRAKKPWKSVRNALNLPWKSVKNRAKTPWKSVNMIYRTLDNQIESHFLRPGAC